MILIIQLVRSDEGELKPYPLKACRGFSHDFFRCASLSPQIDCRCHDARDSCNRQPECVLRWRRWNRWQISNGKFLARLLAVLICGGWWQIILQPATLHTKITDEISNGFSGETSSQHKNTMNERERNVDESQSKSFESSSSLTLVTRVCVWVGNMGGKFDYNAILPRSHYLNVNVSGALLIFIFKLKLCGVFSGGANIFSAPFDTILTHTERLQSREL